MEDDIHKLSMELDNVNTTYTWLIATFVYNHYKGKYAFKYNDGFILRNTGLNALSMLEDDIDKLNMLLLEYNNIFKNESIALISSKLTDAKFRRSILRELRELFYEV